MFSRAKLWSYAVVVSVLSGACVPAAPALPPVPVTRFVPEASAPAAPPESGDVQWFSDAKELPFGFAHRNHYYPPAVHEGFPNKQDPHRLLGRVEISYPERNREDVEAERRNSREDFVERSRRARAAEMEAIKQVAKEHGANAVYQDDRKFYALHISHAEPEYQGAPADKLIAGVAPKNGKELTRETWDLAAGEATKPISVQGRRGHCYEAVSVFQPGAMPGRESLAVLSWSVKHPVESPDWKDASSGRSLLNDEMDGVTKRAAHVNLTCVVLDQPFMLNLHTKGGGTGNMSVVLYERAAMPEIVDRVCAACSPQNMHCGNIAAHACQPLLNCMAASKVDLSQCKR